MPKRFKVAVVGAGEMGGEHITGWTLAGHEVVSIADVDLARARALAATRAIPHAYADYRASVADPAVDIVSICTPLAWHAPVAIAAAAQGKHVFCEKPLARSLAEARAMEEALTRSAVQFGLGFQRNLAAGVAMLRQWAQEGRFGRPLVFSSDLLQEVRPKFAMHDRQGNNGPIMDVGCHYYLLWQTVFQSTPTTVYAQGRVLAKDRPELAHLVDPAIDTAVITVAYASGDLASMTVSWGLAQHCKLRGRPDRLFGPQGGAEGDVNKSLTVYQGDQVETFEFVPQNLHQKEFSLFADALERGQPAPIGLRQGKEMLALTEAIFTSLETGHVVPVSYDF